MKILPIKTKRTLEKIIPVYREVFSESPYNEKWKSEKSVFEYISHNWQQGKDFSFYLEDTKEIVGFIISRFWVRGIDKEVYITEFGIRKDKRNQGFGKLLLNQVISKSKKKKVKTIYLSSNKKSKAIAFYKHFGFKEDVLINLSKKL